MKQNKAELEKLWIVGVAVIFLFLFLAAFLVFRSEKLPAYGPEKNTTFQEVPEQNEPVSPPKVPEILNSQNDNVPPPPVPQISTGSDETVSPPPIPQLN